LSFSHFTNAPFSDVGISFSHHCASVLVSCHRCAFSMQAVREEQGDAVSVLDGDEMACHLKIMKASGFAWVMMKSSAVMEDV